MKQHPKNFWNRFFCPLCALGSNIKLEETGPVRCGYFHNGEERLTIDKIDYHMRDLCKIHRKLVHKANERWKKQIEQEMNESWSALC